MRKTNTALGYRKTEGCCQLHPSCLTMTKTQKNAKTKRQHKTNRTEKDKHGPGIASLIQVVELSASFQ